MQKFAYAFFALSLLFFSSACATFPPVDSHQRIEVQESIWNDHLYQGSERIRPDQAIEAVELKYPDHPVVQDFQNYYLASKIWGWTALVCLIEGPVLIVSGLPRAGGIFSGAGIGLLVGQIIFARSAVFPRFKRLFDLWNADQTSGEIKKAESHHWEIAPWISPNSLGAGLSFSF